MESDKLSREDLVAEFLPEVRRLLRYLPWLVSKRGEQVSSLYTGDGSFEVMSVPVYDTNLLNFINEIKKSPHIDRNYVYTFSRSRLKTVQDELHFISQARLQDAQDIWNVISKYVLKGMTKGGYWSQGVESGVFAAALEKLRELMESETGKRV